MALLDRVVPQNKIPKGVEDRLTRGKDAKDKIAPKRDECWSFLRGDQTAYVDEKNILQVQATTTSIRGGGKPRHRVRQSRNLILDAVAHEVSAATQRVPSYEISPSTTDPEDIGAARLSEKVALYGYDQWNLRQKTVEAVTGAIVADEAFAWAFWDSTIGPYVDDGEGGKIGLGDVRVWIFTSNQVYWEPGSRFMDSGWHAIDMAMPPERVERMEGFLGGKLAPDADLVRKPGQGETKQVLVTYYLERPHAGDPKGKWLTLANGRQICPEKPYPGDSDDPVLHKLSYITDPDSDRDMGLVRHLLDAQRTYNDANNKAVEWKNLCLMPQFVVSSPQIFKNQRRTDEPGHVYYIPQPDQNFKVIDPPAIPRELFEIADRAQADLSRIAAQNDVPQNVEAGKAIEALIERDQARRQAFLAGLADFHSRLMRSCLTLVQEHYTEPRLLKVKGRFGWERVADFMGAHLRSQCDVRVSAGSIEPRTRKSMEEKLLAFADRGWISPQAAMHGIETGTAEKTIDDVMLDVERVNRIIQRIEEGERSLFGQPERVVGVEPQMIEDPTGIAVDPATGGPATVRNAAAGMPIMAPSWMPTKADNTDIWKSVLEAYMKTESFERLPVPMQTAGFEIYTQVLALQQQAQMEIAAQQSAMAAQQGMENAAAPQGPKALPDKTAVGSDNNLPTMNQPKDQSPPT